MKYERKKTQGIEVSTNAIIINIRQVRDKELADLLNEPLLRFFLEKHYDILATSSIKIEFLKRDLLELKNSSLDLVHYATLIKQMKESGSEMPFEKHPSFLYELKMIFKRNGFE